MTMQSRPRQLRCALLTASISTGLGLSLLATAALADTPTPHSDGVGAVVSDTAITAKVKASFASDERLKDSHIKVVTANGIVTLTGTAPNSETKVAADDLAKNVEGVSSVDDELVTGTYKSPIHHTIAKSERVGSDSWITTKVKSELVSDSVSKGFEVHVKTLHGVVMLDGTLSNPDAIAHVKDVAEKIQGVKSVDTSALKSSAG